MSSSLFPLSLEDLFISPISLFPNVDSTHTAHLFPLHNMFSDIDFRCFLNRDGWRLAVNSRTHFSFYLRLVSRIYLNPRFNVHYRTTTHYHLLQMPSRFPLSNWVKIAINCAMEWHFKSFCTGYLNIPIGVWYVNWSDPYHSTGFEYRNEHQLCESGTCSWWVLNRTSN